MLFALPDFTLFSSWHCWPHAPEPSSFKPIYPTRKGPNGQSWASPSWTYERVSIRRGLAERPVSNPVGLKTAFLGDPPLWSCRGRERTVGGVGKTPAALWLGRKKLGWWKIYEFGVTLTGRSSDASSSRSSLTLSSPCWQWGIITPALWDARGWWGVKCSPWVVGSKEWEVEAEIAWGTVRRGQCCFNVSFCIFFFLPALSIITYFSGGKEKQARFFGSLNVILPWLWQFCQSNKRGFLVSLSPLHPGNEFLK